MITIFWYSKYKTFPYLNQLITIKVVFSSGTSSAATISPPGSYIMATEAVRRTIFIKKKFLKSIVTVIFDLALYPYYFKTLSM